MHLFVLVLPHLTRHGKYWSVRSMNTALLKCELLAVEVMYAQLVPYPGFPQPLILKYIATCYVKPDSHM